jgi:hypothetical protein
MSFYSSSSAIIILLLINLTFIWTSSSIIKTNFRSLRNATSSLNLRQRISAQADKVRNYSSAARDRLHFPHRNHDEEIDHEVDENAIPSKEQTSVVVLTSLTGIYVWWPILFGGDDSFHLLLTQEDVPRFHDVAGDNSGHIYLTSPHERTVYRLQYSNGWWIANFSNHSVMNSIRSEMPLFLTIHYISSIVYVYGHSDIQVIDLIQRPRTRGSAPFMKRLRELSPSLRISDMVIDQIKSDGYIIGDSYGWCTVIRCSLSVSECEFLFKVPSSYDNRPYLCSATIDFSSKIMYLSLEEKILAVHLNEQTNFDRRETLTEKLGSRSALGYDDIVTYNNVILYTDVLRPLLHICTLINSNTCLNISLIFPSIQRSILPLRLSIIQVSDLRPPILDDEEDIELHINQTTTTTISSSTEIQRLVADKSTKSYVHKETSVSNIWMLILGISIGLLLAGLSFMIYYVTWNKNRPTCKSDSTIRNRIPLLRDESQPKFESMISQSTSSSSEPIAESASDSTTITTSSSSYRPDTIL